MIGALTRTTAISFFPETGNSVQSDMRVSSNWQALAKNATSPFAGN